MNRVLYRVMGIIVSIIVLFSLGYQIYNNMLTPYRTETAYVYLQSDYVAADGLIVRDELVLWPQSDGVISYLREDGDKVSLSMPVAQVYQTQQDAENQTAIQKLEQEIALLEEASAPGRADYINAEVLNGQISDRLSRISHAIQSRNLSGLDTVKTDYLMLLNTRQIATARATNFNARITQLKDEVQSLKGATQPPLSTVTAKKPGYFVGAADGYEETLTTAQANELTPSTVKQIIDARPNTVVVPGAVGKLITGFEWFYCALVREEDAARFRKGLTLSVTFPFLSNTAYPALVTAVTPEDGTGYTTVTMRISIMNAEVCTMRTQKSEISFASYRGLKVRADALRFQDGEPGVYVINGAGVRFKKIDIIFYGDGYVLSRQREEKGYLALYDEMVIEGRELAQGA